MMGEPQTHLSSIRIHHHHTEGIRTRPLRQHPMDFLKTTEILF